MNNWKERAEKNRMKRNQEIAREVQSGEFMPAPINREMSWFPPRPIIKKDLRAVNQLMGTVKLVEPEQEAQ